MSKMLALGDAVESVAKASPAGVDRKIYSSNTQKSARKSPKKDQDAQ